MFGIKEKGAVERPLLFALCQPANVAIGHSEITHIQMAQNFGRRENFLRGSNG